MCCVLFVSFKQRDGELCQPQVHSHIRRCSQPTGESFRLWDGVGWCQTTHEGHKCAPAHEEGAQRWCLSRTPGRRHLIRRCGVKSHAVLELPDTFFIVLTRNAGSLKNCGFCVLSFACRRCNGYRGNEWRPLKKTESGGEMQVLASLQKWRWVFVPPSNHTVQVRILFPITTVFSHSVGNFENEF